MALLTVKCRHRAEMTYENYICSFRPSQVSSNVGSNGVPPPVIWVPE